jgi:hypothetical protein
MRRLGIRFSIRKSGVVAQFAKSLTTKGTKVHEGNLSPKVGRVPFSPVVYNQKFSFLRRITCRIGL